MICEGDSRLDSYFVHFGLTQTVTITLNISVDPKALSSFDEAILPEESHVGQFI
jgi:hypothetical protein